MKYMLLIYLTEGVIDRNEAEACYAESAAVARRLHEEGKFLGASPLHPTATATSVRVRDGKPLITDGPFAETREQLGGYFLVDAESDEEAVAIAARIPGARFGIVEVRRLLEVPGVPEV